MLESEALARSPSNSMVVPCWIEAVSKVFVEVLVGTIESSWSSLRSDFTYLCPSPIALLHNFRDCPAFGLGFAAENILNDHGGREGGGDVEDFEIAVITRLSVKKRKELPLMMKRQAGKILTTTSPNAYPPKPCSTY